MKRRLLLLLGLLLLVGGQAAYLMHHARAVGYPQPPEPGVVMGLRPPLQP